MPPKRPAPLSDAVLAPRERQAALGETNAGAPLPVKNTFIDVPSGFTPTSTQAKKQPVSTAPAQVGVAAGFVRSSILASVQSAVGITPAPAAAAPASPMKVTASNLQPALPPPPSPKRGGPLAVQRPGGAVPGTPLVTPSPTGTSAFSAARYQLFGGPAPVQEATHSALAPAGGGQCGTLAAFAPLQAGALGGSSAAGPLSYGPPDPGGGQPPAPGAGAAEQAETGGGSPPRGAPEQRLSAATLVASAAESAVASKAQRLPSVRQESRSKEDGSEDEDSEDAEGEQPAAAARSPEDAPKPPPGALHPSLGSEQHGEGACKRCCFFPRNRCHNGYDCEFCHYEHEKRKRKSKKKKKKDAAASAEATSAASETSPVATVTSPVATVASPGASAVVIPATTVTSPTTTVTSPTTTVTSPVTTFIAVASPLAAVTGPADARMVAVPMPAGVAGAPVHAPPLPPGAAPPMAFAAGPTPLPPAPPAGAVVGPGLPPAAAAPPAGVAVGVPPGPPAAMLVGAPVLAAATTVLQPALAHVIYGPTQQYAPPPQLPPRLQQVVELTPPPPMQSPKMRQGDMGIVQGGAPISSR